jgi:hypothetical protein
VQQSKQDASSDEGGRNKVRSRQPYASKLRVMSLSTTEMQRNQMKKEKEEDEDDGKKNKRVSALRKKITQRDTEVYGKIQDAFEHVVVTGAKVRRDNWRHREFLRSSQQDQDRVVECPHGVDDAATQNDDDDDDKNDNSARRRPRKRKRQQSTMLCHTEDIRIYGNSTEGPFKRGCPMKPWPSEGVTTTTKKKEDNHHIHQQHHRKTKTKIRKSDDTEWNVEHGDSVPPVLFRMARLSQEYPSEERLRIFNKDASLSRMKTLQSTDITLDKTDVPRALIERCWERAVHAASNSMFASIAAAVTTTTTTNQTPSIIPTQQSTSSRPCHQLQHTGLQIDMNKPLSQESCRIKCKSLGIDIESERAKAIAISKEASTSASACPRCFRSFETSDELQKHYYGNGVTKGCCWPLVRPRHLELIDKLLQSHVQSHTDQLLNVIMMTQAAAATDNDADDGTTASKEKNVANKERKRLLDWKDVRSFLQGAIDDSSSFPIGASNDRINARHSVQQSLQTTVSNESTPPLILNQMVLDAVNRRLVDRYANVPR